MQDKKLEDYSKEELISIIKSIKKQKKFGLVWEDKPEKVAIDCKEKLPVLNEDASKAISKALGQPTNIIIEGDNYHSLSILNYTHQKTINLIYIDPPYNTGNASWRYNNRIINSDDDFKHSKFISFMNRRLRLAKNLLSEDGLIAVAIDDYEMQNVRLLMDEIYGEDNRLGTCVVIHNPGGRQDDKFIATTHEYMLIYAKNKDLAEVGYLELTEEKKSQFVNTDKYGGYKLRSFIRTGAHSRPNERPGLFYPIYINPQTKDIDIEKHDGWIELYPKDSKSENRVWRWSGKTLMDKKEKYIECKEKSGNYSLYVKERESDNKGYKPKTLWSNPNYSSASAMNQLKTILAGKRNSDFPFPKSVFLMKDVIKILSKPDSIVLDFFAGSGTTGQAVLELNKEDNGRRRFIICTNNENKIAEEVTYQRIAAVINGYQKVPGIPANVRYFSTSFVEKEQTLDKLRRKLTPACEDMIRVREGIFNKIIDEDLFKVFEENGQIVGVIYDRFELEKYIDQIEELKTDKPVHLYVFSYDNSGRLDEVTKTTKHEYESQPIPEGVLEIYKKIFKDRRH